MPLHRLVRIWILACLLAALPLWGQNSIAIACPGQAPAGSSVNCSLTIAWPAGVTADSLLLGVQVTNNGAAPALSQGQLSFADSVGEAFTVTAGTTNQMGIMWSSLSHVLGGSKYLGAVTFVLPASASLSQSYTVAITGPSASLANNSVALTTGSPVTVAVGNASLQSVSLTSGQQGQTVSNIVITGQNTAFVQGATVADFGFGITVNSLTVTSPTSATASIAIGTNATPGAHDVSLTTGTTVGTLNAAFTVIPAPSLSITKSHTGKFVQGQTGAAYFITVANAAGAGPTNAVVTVAESLPAGLSLVSIDGGSAWSCTAQPLQCTTSNVLAGGSSYPAIVVTVNLAATAATPITNQVSVSGGGSATAYASDPTVVTSPCDLNQDEHTDVLDARKIVTQALGVAQPVSDLNHDGAISVVEIQMVINGSLGCICPAH